MSSTVAASVRGLGCTHGGHGAGSSLDELDVLLLAAGEPTEKEVEAELVCMFCYWWY